MQREQSSPTSENEEAREKGERGVSVVEMRGQAKERGRKKRRGRERAWWKLV